MIRWSQRSIWSGSRGAPSAAGRLARRAATIAIENAAARRPRPSSWRRLERPATLGPTIGSTRPRLGSGDSSAAAVGAVVAGTGAGGGVVLGAGGVTGRAELPPPLETLRATLEPAGLSPVTLPLMTLPLGMLDEAL